MFGNFNKRSRDRAVVTASILSILSYNAALAGNGEMMGGSHQNDSKAQSPIKHVIVIMGENRTFDHVFAAYKPHPGKSIDNLLSRKIIDEDGSPGPNYAKARQNSASDTGVYSIHPGNKLPYSSATLQTPSTSYAFQACYSDIQQAALNGPGCLINTTLAAEADYGLLTQDLPLLTRGATGLPPGSPDSRILDYNVLPNGPYPLVKATDGTSLYDTYGGSPVHRFYQMWQQLDCDVAAATRGNPSGCQADLFPWVEQTVSSGSNGAPPHPLSEGNIAMGFYNSAAGDAAYLTALANLYTLNDNYHQPVMGGTYANQMMFAYADALYYADAKGDPATPDHVLVPGSNPPQYVIPGFIYST